jgi:hypothetical protein
MQAPYAPAADTKSAPGKKAPTVARATTIRWRVLLPVPINHEHEASDQLSGLASAASQDVAGATGVVRRQVSVGLGTYRRRTTSHSKGVSIMWW